MDDVIDELRREELEQSGGNKARVIYQRLRRRVGQIGSAINSQRGEDQNLGEQAVANFEFLQSVVNRCPALGECFERDYGPFRVTPVYLDGGDWYSFDPQGLYVQYHQGTKMTPDDLRIFARENNPLVERFARTDRLQLATTLQKELR